MADDRHPTLMETLTQEEASTLVRRPISTVAPPPDAQLGQRALAVLKTLSHDTRALEPGELLGQGGMGVVRATKQVALDRTVALKTLKPTLQAQRDVEALLAEAWLTGRLEHPNILPVYSLSLDAGGLPQVVMKRIEGVTWGTLIRDAAAMKKHAPDVAPLDEHLRILEQVCNAVHYAHARGVVHRDLKPDNVMVGAFGEVYVVDWGIATTFGPATVLAGTPAYMAPEMVTGGRLDARTDVYLLGAMLSEVLTGQPPHTGTSPNELFQNVLRSEPKLPANAPEELAALVRTAMHADATARPPTALDFRKALEAFRQHQGSIALAQQSARRASELQELVLGGSTDRHRIDALFSECRFGFQMALTGWPGNTRARRELDQVLELMVRFELQHGSPRAAQLLLSEFDAPAELKAEVQVALSAEEQKKLKLQRLESLELSLDPRTGGVTRTVVAVAIGLVWVLAPMVSHYLLHLEPRYEMLATAPVTAITALVLFGVRIKAVFRPLDWTPLNQQLLRAVAFGNLVQFAAVSFLYSQGFFIGERGPAVTALYWALVSGVLATTVLPKVWLTSAGYFVCGVIAWYWPDARHFATMGASFVLCINAVWLASEGGYLKKQA